MGYYLLDNRGSRSANWYTSRRGPLRVIVMHITAGLEDLDTVNDHSAENTARYAATVTDRKVSWHAGADADSFLYLLPASYTAFHCRNYNSTTYGVEISKRHVKWAGMDPTWVSKTLRNAAEAVAPVCRSYDIPRRLLSKRQVDAGEKGFTSHAFLDPTRRSDPGADFPWDRFFQMVNQILSPGTTRPDDPPEDDMFTDDDRRILQSLRPRLITDGKNPAVYVATVTGGRWWVPNGAVLVNMCRALGLDPRPTKDGGHVETWARSDIDALPLSGPEAPGVT